MRVVGLPDAVRAAGALVRQELEPHNKVTMKIDVSWTHHSHIIGKGGNTIQPVVKRTGGRNIVHLSSFFFFSSV